MAIGLAMILALSFAIPAFAGDSHFNYSGNAYRNFKTHTSVTKDSSAWSYFRCRIDNLSYTFSNYTYTLVRPISKPGSVQFADPVQMSAGDIEIFCPNGTSHNYDIARFQFFNIDNRLNGATDNLMHVDGGCKIGY